MSTGLLVSRVGEDDGDLGPQLTRQLLANAQPMRIGAVVLALMALIPGLPKVPFLLIAGARGSPPHGPPSARRRWTTRSRPPPR